MEENFFIENPESFENNFHCASKDFQKGFKERSKEIVKVMAMKSRHAKRMNKKKRNEINAKVKTKAKPS